MTDSAKPSALRPGDWVVIEGMAGYGQVVALDERHRRARVLLKQQEWSLALDRLTPTAPPNFPAPQNLVHVVGSHAVCHQIDLHGLRVEDALEATDRALDQAVVNHLTQLKIIHGHGTGAVRTAVRQMLARHHHVANFRFGGPAEGGLACTIAELRLPAPRERGRG